MVVIQIMDVIIKILWVPYYDVAIDCSQQPVTIGVMLRGDLAMMKVVLGC